MITNTSVQKCFTIYSEVPLVRPLSGRSKSGLNIKSVLKMRLFFIEVLFGTEKGGLKAELYIVNVCLLYFTNFFILYKLHKIAKAHRDLLYSFCYSESVYFQDFKCKYILGLIYSQYLISLLNHAHFKKTIHCITLIA